MWMRLFHNRGSRESRAEEGAAASPSLFVGLSVSCVLIERGGASGLLAPLPGRALSGCSAAAGGAVPAALSEQTAWLVAAPPPGNPLALFKSRGQFDGAVVKGSSIIFSSS